MKKNLGNADRIIRLVLAAIFTILYMTNALPGAWGLALMTAGSVIALTSIFSFCPLYFAPGLHSNQIKS